MQDHKTPAHIPGQQPVPRITMVLPGSGHTWGAAGRECCHLFYSVLPRRPNQAWTLKQALASDLFLSIIQVVCSDPNLRCRTFHCTAFFLLSWLTHLGLAEMLRILQSPCIYHGFSETKSLFCRILAKKSYSGSKGDANVMNRRRGWILHFQA